MKQYFFGRRQIGAIAPALASLPARARNGLLCTMFAAQRRERDLLVAEAGKVRALMPLLMKQRNGGRWTREERVALRAQLRALAHLSPYLLLLLLPGSFALLPLLAWWLDRRRLRREGDPTTQIPID